MAGRTGATLLAAMLVGVLVPGIALMSSGHDRPAARSTDPAAATSVAAAVGAMAPSTSTVPPPAPTTIAAPPVEAPPVVGPAPTLVPTTPPVPTGPPVVTRSADIGVLAPRDVSAPTRVLIPALGIDGPVLPAGVNEADELDVPPDARTLVWYRHGPTPGDRGSAVIAGHLNWRGTTGILAELASVPSGTTITVVYEDGSQRDFVVRSVELVPKPALAVRGVFDRRGERLLRLVTCGGEFDDATHHYRSNVVVTAAPV